MQSGGLESQHARAQQTQTQRLKLQLGVKPGDSRISIASSDEGIIMYGLKYTGLASKGELPTKTVKCPWLNALQ